MYCGTNGSNRFSSLELRMSLAHLRRSEGVAAALDHGCAPAAAHRLASSHVTDTSREEISHMQAKLRAAGPADGAWESQQKFLGSTKKRVDNGLREPYQQTGLKSTAAADDLPHGQEGAPFHMPLLGGQLFQSKSHAARPHDQLAHDYQGVEASSVPRSPPPQPRVEPPPSVLVAGVASLASGSPNPARPLSASRRHLHTPRDTCAKPGPSPFARAAFNLRAWGACARAIPRNRPFLRHAGTSSVLPRRGRTTRPSCQQE